MGAGRAAWLVLTGEPIDARRAYEWGLVEEVCAVQELDQTVGRVVESLMAGDRAALRMQKELLQVWQEQPLAASVALSVERFSQAYTISRAKASKEH
jgi:enoyl-CoA hydratase/carnithine racemase